MLMVAGGAHIGIDDTEIFDGQAWRTVKGKLPLGLAAFQIINHGGKILLFGNKYKAFSLYILINSYFKVAMMTVVLVLAETIS